MRQYYEVEDKVKKLLSQKRFTHSLGVVESALQLAQKYHCDVEKVKIAAIAHDCAKDFSKEELLKITKDNNLEIDYITLNECQLLHGPVGVLIAQTKLQITDIEILNAIYYHTTGKPDMSILEKIIYLADFIEPNRDYPGVEKLRKLAMIDLDRALLQALDNTIIFVTSMHSLLHPRTIESRNFLILEKKINNYSDY